MKNILIRIGCVFAGLFLTFGILLFLCAFDTKKADIVIVTENPEEEEALIKAVDIAEEFGLDDEIMERLQLPEIATVEEETTETASVSANAVPETKLNWLSDYPKVNSNKTLEQKLQERSSFAETVSMNVIDQEVIANNTIDFSDIKITIMGDSITTGVRLEEEGMEHAAYPNLLKDILGCKEVVNLGIGGSSVSRQGNYAMVERWSEIPKDSDIIIIFGSSNDCLFETNEEFGIIEVDNRSGADTFCGDLDEMLSGIQEEYVINNAEGCAKLLYINPPSTMQAQAVYEGDPENMAHQSMFAEAINTIAPEYGFEVIDLYNNNILNSCEKETEDAFVPDCIHPNAEGHRILAEHIASQIIQRIEQ